MVPEDGLERLDGPKTPTPPQHLRVHLRPQPQASSSCVMRRFRLLSV